MLCFSAQFLGEGVLFLVFSVFFGGVGRNKCVFFSGSGSKPLYLNLSSVFAFYYLFRCLFNLF